MQTPKVYLVSRNLTDEQFHRIKLALAITPVQAVIATDPRDMNKALELCDTAQGLHRPVAVLADFADPLTAVNDDGTVTPVEF